MANSTSTSTVITWLKTLPAVLLSFEFFLGGIPRMTPIPLRSLHHRIYQKSTQTAPELYPIIPFRDVRMHMRYVGAWMVATGVLLAVPATRGSLVTLGLVWFWTGAGAWSQARTGMPFWLPIVNATLGAVVWWVEN